MEGKSPRRPGRPRSERARRAALDAALALLADRGLAGMSVDAVCERAGISKATVYRHWSSKEHLCIDALSCVPTDVVETHSGDTRADVIAVVTDLARMTESSEAGRLLARLVGAAADNPELTRVWRATIVAPRRARLARLIVRAVDQGELRPDTDVELVVDLLVGPLFYRRLITGTGGPAPAQLVEAVWDGFRRRSR